MIADKKPRRTFLKIAGAGLAGGVLTTARGEPRRPAPTGLHLGVVTYNIAKSWDVPAIIKNLTDAGYEGVELRTTHAHGVEIILPPDRRAEVRKMFQDSPIKLAGLGTTCEFQSADPQEVARQIAETKEWIRLARDVGSPSIKVRPNGLPKEVAEEKTLEQIGRSLRECGDVAADQGIKIQLEVHGPDTSRVPRIKKILDYADRHPAVWVCWNSGQPDLLDGGLEDNFNSIKSRIGQVHMRDLYLEEYPWRRLIRLLQECQFQGFCFAEIDESRDPMRVLAYFRAMFRAYQGII
jgi:sugar phosphate isomerase/epimerase